MVQNSKEYLLNSKAVDRLSIHINVNLLSFVVSSKVGSNFGKLEVFILFKAKKNLIYKQKSSTRKSNATLKAVPE